MPYGKKSAKRRRGSAGRRRKGTGKRGLSKAAKKQVESIVHGQAEKFSRQVELRAQNLFTARTIASSGALYFAPPSVIPVGGIALPKGDYDYMRRGEEINMRSIRVRIWFSLRAPDSTVLPNLNGPRKVLWWVVSDKKHLPLEDRWLGGPIDAGSPNAAPHYCIQGTNADFSKFFAVPHRSGILDQSAQPNSDTRHFEGDRYDAVDPVNRELFTVHSKGSFTIGYSQRPMTATENLAYATEDFGKVPYSKDLVVSIPKMMLGKTEFLQASNLGHSTTDDKTNKKCWIVMTSYPLTSYADNPSEQSGILYDYRVKYEWTDM